MLTSDVIKYRAYVSIAHHAKPEEPRADGRRARVARRRAGASGAGALIVIIRKKTHIDNNTNNVNNNNDNTNNDINNNSNNNDNNSDNNM